MEVSPSVRAVQVPDDKPMHPQFTSMYIVGKDQVMTIDSGEDLDRYRWMLRGYLAATERAEIALAGITHHHSDHSANLKWLREIYKADVLVHPEGVELLEKVLPEEGVQTLQDNQVLDLGGGVRLQIMHTPGHSVDSMCYYLEDEGVLFTGDTVLGFGTVTMRDLYTYMHSLERLVALPNLKVICPGHGPLVHDPRERIQGYIDHRNQREREILGVLGEGGEISSWDIMLKVYGDLEAKFRRAASGNVETHLTKLEKEGRLKTNPGVRKEKTPEQLAKEEAEARERAEIEAKHKEHEEHARQAALTAQENPPTDEWEEMPKYELVGKP